VFEIKTKRVEQADEKTEVTLKIMHSLPSWFSPPEDIDKKAIVHREYPFFAAYDEDKPIGFIVLKIHNEYAVEIFNVGVLEQYHRQGIGRHLLKAAERYCADNGFLYLTVKTLDASAEYEPYERTRLFYKKMGFIPLEVFKALWNEENPCLFLVKRLQEQQDILSALQADPFFSEANQERLQRAAARMELTGGTVHGLIDI